MLKLTIGYLFKKKYIKHKFKEYEIFEFVDYVNAIGYLNKKQETIYNIIGGNYSGTYASDITDSNVKQDELVFFGDNLQKAIQENNNSVDYEEIRKKKIENTAKYYIESKNGNGLTMLENKAIIDLLAKENKKTT